MKNWSELPRDLLCAIARRLEVAADRVRFSGVCRNWLSLAKSEINYLPPDPPWLMLNEKPDSDDREFVGANGKERFVVKLPKSRGRRCLGSSGCWLVMIDEAFDVYVLNPFSGMKIDFPSLLDEFLLDEDEFCVRKVILSFPKSHSPIEEFIIEVALIMRCKVAYTKNGAKSYQYMESIGYDLVDAIFFQDKIYAVDDYGIILEFNVHDEKPNTVPISDLLHNSCMQRYLVEFQGLLLQVINLNDPWESAETSGFHVFKLNFTSGKWVKLKDLGQHSIFLDECNCVSLLATSNSTFQPNCIYYSIEKVVMVWDDDNGWNYMGGVCVFNLTDSVTVPYYGGPYAVPVLPNSSDSDFDTDLTHPVWIIPTSSSQNQ